MEHFAPPSLPPFAAPLRPRILARLERILWPKPGTSDHSPPLQVLLHLLLYTALVVFRFPVKEKHRILATFPNCILAYSHIIGRRSARSSDMGAPKIEAQPQ